MKNSDHIRISLIMFWIWSIMLFIPAVGWSMIASNVPGITIFGSQDDAFHLSFGPSFQIETGDMTYTIQGPEDGGWKSRLKWDLEKLFYLGGLASVRFRGKYELTAGVWKAVAGGDDGTMQDDDWFYGDYGSSLAVQSLSDLETDGFHFNVNLRYHFRLREGLTLSPVAGYSYTKWDWETLEGYQTSIDPLAFYVGPLEAGSIIYQEELHVPYLGLAFSGLIKSSGFGFNVYALLSLIVQCYDEDDHTLRSKLIKGDADGSFLSLGGDLRWEITKSWSIAGNVNYTRYDLNGEQEQYYYAGDYADTLFTGIDLEIEGSQTYFGLMAVYEF
ncbi:outer membrane protease [Candidatus Vecturithrix granuli]|uniref:Outer membrane protease n=1 Tax=Vecturithrix granuli TaxID=1499967 RepID=A0A081C7M7_VECG1|nr:outer membrane protease [Candidatus Vecturithrix granuli]